MRKSLLSAVIIAGTFNSALAYSNDTSFNSFTLDSESINNPVLEIGQLNHSEIGDGFLLAGMSTAYFKIPTKYSGKESLVYQLLNKPKGMTIDFNEGYVYWSVPFGMAGKNVNFTVRVSDGNISARKDFSLKIAPELDCNSTAHKTSISVDSNCELRGMTLSWADVITDIDRNKINPDSLNVSIVKEVPALPDNLRAIGPAFRISQHGENVFTPDSFSLKSPSFKGLHVSNSESLGIWAWGESVDGRAFWSRIDLGDSIPGSEMLDAKIYTTGGIFQYAVKSL